MFLRIFTAAGSLLFIPPVSPENTTFIPIQSVEIGLSCDTAPNLGNLFYEAVSKTRNDPLFLHLKKQRTAGALSEAEAQQLLILEITILDAEKIILVTDYVSEICRRKNRA